MGRGAGRPQERGLFAYHSSKLQQLWLAVLYQAQIDAFSDNRRVRSKAINFLFDDASDVAVMAQGIANPDDFREQLLEHMTAEVVRVSFPGRPTFVINGKEFWKEKKQEEQQRRRKQCKAVELEKAA
jgi:hypothetical protein